jgi:type II secretory pathway pseudopilin PulG
MNALRATLTRAQHDEGGIGIIEVIVALGIFMIVSIGIAYSAISSLRLAADSESREVAANLAASEIDNARAAADPLDLFNNIRIVTVDGLDYTISRTTGWVSATGTSSGCGTGTGALQYKQVDVKVTWPTRLERTSPVRSNTLIAPVSRLNDPSLGTILVSALAAAGTGSSGIPVTVTRVSGGAAVTMDPTDFDGCSYAFQVTPGTYNIKLSKNNYISSSQETSPTTSVTVTAGGTVSAAFSYDNQAKFNLKYASNVPSATPLFPSNLDTTFVSTYGVYKTTGVSSSINLHPFSSGYSAIAGKYLAPVAATPPLAAIPGCLSPDPSSWAEGTVGGVDLAAGQDSPSVAAAPGQTVALDIPMGVFSFKYTGYTGSQDRYLVATSVTPPSNSGDPGCETGMVYNFTQKLATNNSTSYTIALPYGSWSLKTSTSATSSANAVAVTDVLIGGLLGYPTANASTFTLDPRAPR